MRSHIRSASHVDIFSNDAGNGHYLSSDRRNPALRKVSRFNQALSPPPEMIKEESFLDLPTHESAKKRQRQAEDLHFSNEVVLIQENQKLKRKI
jgi:hypothetical protein